MWPDIEWGCGRGSDCSYVPLSQPFLFWTTWRACPAHQPTENPLLMPVYKCIPIPIHSWPGAQHGPTLKATKLRGRQSQDPEPSLQHRTTQPIPNLSTLLTPNRSRDVANTGPRSKGRRTSAQHLHPRPGLGSRGQAPPTRRPTAPRCPRSPGTVRVPLPPLPSRCSGAPSPAPPLPAEGGPTAPARPHRPPPSPEPRSLLADVFRFRSIFFPQFGPAGRP